MSKKRGASNKATFHIELDRSEYELYRAWAQSRGVPLQDWVKGVLGQAIPRQVRENQRRDNGSARAVLEQAYAAVDNDDAATLGLPPPNPPPSPIEDHVEPPPNAKHLPVVSMSQAHTIGHPCRYLVREFSGVFTERDSSGKCSKLNKVCFWAPTGARNCMDFAPKAQLRPPPPSVR